MKKIRKMHGLRDNQHGAEAVPIGTAMVIVPSIAAAHLRAGLRRLSLRPKVKTSSVIPNSLKAI
jgi:hypothetical protein